MSRKKVEEQEPIKKKKTVKTETKKVVKTRVKKEKKELLPKKDQKTLKVLSRVVSIIAKVLRVCSMIILPFIFVSLVIIPLIAKDIDVGGNIIYFQDAKFVLNDDYITANIADKTYLLADNVKNIDKIVNYLNSNSITKSVTGAELLLFFAGVIITINIYLLKNTEDLFKNIYSNETPFTEENCNHIHKICRIMIAILVASIVFNIVLSLCIDNKFSVLFTPYGIVSIIVIYILYYIFTYATNMQKETKTVIYN